MKITFSFLLIYLTFSFLSAQETTSEWRVSYIKAPDEKQAFKVLSRPFELDSVTEGWATGLTFLHFEEAIQYSDRCSISFPRDEKIHHISAKYVFTLRKVYAENSLMVLSKFLIQDCKSERIASRNFPYETNFHVGNEGQVLATDNFMDYGKKIYILDDDLQTEAEFEPFEEGFNELFIEEDKDDWLLILSRTEGKEAHAFFKLNKNSHSLSEPTFIPVKPHTWYPFYSFPEGLLYCRQWRKLTFCDPEGEIVWQHDRKIYYPSVLGENLIFYSNDSLFCLHALTGQEKWASPLSKLAKDILPTTLPEGITSCELRVGDLQQNEKGILLIIESGCFGFATPFPTFPQQIVFLDLQGKVLVHEMLNSYSHSIKCLLYEDSFSIYTDDDILTYEIPK